MAKENLDIVIGAKDKFSATFGKANNELDKLDKSGKGFNRSFTIGIKGATAAVAAFAGAMIIATKASIELNRSMASIATLIPNSSDRVVELKENVQDLSIELGKSTEDLSAGLFQIVSAFGDAADSAEKLRIVAKASVAGNATTTESLNLLSAVTKGYGDTSAEALAKVADLAFVTNKLGQTTFPELASSMGKVVPLAVKLGQSQEELFAVFATLTGVTGNTAEVSSQLAGIQRSLIKPTKDMSKAIKDLGFTSAEALVESEGLVGGLQKLIGTTDGSSEAVGKLFGRAEAMTAAFALSGAQAETFAKNLAEAEKASGAADQAFKEQSEGINEFEFELKRLKSAFVVVLQQLGDFVTQNPGFIKALQLAVTAAGKLGTGLEKIQEFGDALGHLVASITGNVPVIREQTNEFFTLTEQINSVKKAMNEYSDEQIAALGLNEKLIDLTRRRDEALKEFTASTVKAREETAKTIEMERQQEELIIVGDDGKSAFRAKELEDTFTHNAALFGIVSGFREADRDNLEEIEAAKLTARQNAIAGAKGLLSGLASTMSTESKAAFEVSKAANITQALLDGRTAVQGAFKHGTTLGGPVLGIAFAGVAAAIAAANVAKIQSTTFGGGGGGVSKPSGGGVSVGGGATPPAPSLTQTRDVPQQGAQQLTVIVNNPLSEGNWEALGEDLAKSLSAAGERNIEINIKNRAEA